MFAKSRLFLTHTAVTIQDAEEIDAMKALENRTKQSRREMDILDALSEIRALNARNSKLSVDDVLAMQRKGVEKETELDADQARRAFEAARQSTTAAASGAAKDDSSDEDEGDRLERLIAEKKKQREAAAAEAAKAAATDNDTTLAADDKRKRPSSGEQVAAKKSRVLPIAVKPKAAAAVTKKPTNAMASLLGAYGSDDDSDSD